MNNRHYCSFMRENILTSREYQILILVASGFSDKEIAEHFFISIRTVNGYLDKIRNKLDAKNRTQAVVKALKYGLITFEEVSINSENDE